MSADSKASNSKFLKGTLILTASSIVVKVIGSLNWIILSRVLGGEGIGLYQMGFPIYLMAITVSSAGVPVAISIITSEKLANKDYRGAKRVFNVSLRVLLLTGLLFSSSLFFGANWLVNNHIIRDSRMPEDDHSDTCSMCGKFCAVRSMNKALADEYIDIL